MRAVPLPDGENLLASGAGAADYRREM